MKQLVLATMIAMLATGSASAGIWGSVSDGISDGIGGAIEGIKDGVDELPGQLSDVGTVESELFTEGFGDL